MVLGWGVLIALSINPFCNAGIRCNGHSQLPGTWSFIALLEVILISFPCYIDAIDVSIYSESCCGGGIKQLFSGFHSHLETSGVFEGKKMTIFFYDRENLLSCLKLLRSLPKDKWLLFSCYC